MTDCLRSLRGRPPREVREPDASALPDLARSALLRLADQLDALAVEIHALERRLLAWHRQDQASQRLATIPGVEIITATALSASPLARKANGIDIPYS